MEVIDEWEAPGRTVSVFTLADGRIQVVSDPGYSSSDWQAACTRLEALSAGLLKGPQWANDSDVWTTTICLN